ncbi:MAG TPA: hypothetical protein VMH81_29895 [Bryobacteraceae bacterium]|nr:hypothetical protein [Bryobacteraceae bacterium]
MLADAFVILVSILFCAVALTQILIPLIQNKPLFISFRRNYQREKWLKQQLDETKRRMAEMELEKQLTEHQNELFRRQMEQMESLGGLASPPVEEGERDVNRRKDISEKER